MYIDYIECKKDWKLNNTSMFIKGKKYQIRDIYMDGDRKIQAYKIGIQSCEIWFWSGSDYFEISYLI